MIQMMFHCGPAKKQLKNTNGGNMTGGVCKLYAFFLWFDVTGRQTDGQKGRRMALIYKLYLDWRMGKNVELIWTFHVAHTYKTNGPTNRFFLVFPAHVNVCAWYL